MPTGASSPPRPRATPVRTHRGPAARLLLAVALLALARIAWAASAEQASGLVNFVNDDAHVLKPAEVRELEAHLVDVSRDGRYQIAIALYPQASTGSATIASAVDSTLLADRLMVGSTLGDRGIVILGFIAERIVRIEIGYGLEGLLPDVDVHQAAELAAAAFARGRYAEGLRAALGYLEPRAQQAAATRAPQAADHEWLPDWMLMVRDATRGYAFYARHREEVPRQIAGWWRSQDPESQSVLAALIGAGAIFVLVCLRPTLGSLLGLLLPPEWTRNRAMRWLFFRGTDASFERAWNSGGPGAGVARGAYLFDLLYYGFATLALPGLALGSFILLVGHPGAFGGAGALARW